MADDSGSDSDDEAAVVDNAMLAAGIEGDMTKTVKINKGQLRSLLVGIYKGSQSGALADATDLALDRASTAEGLRSVNKHYKEVIKVLGALAICELLSIEVESSPGSRTLLGALQQGRDALVVGALGGIAGPDIFNGILVSGVLGPSLGPVKAFLKKNVGDVCAQVWALPEGVVTLDDVERNVLQPARHIASKMTVVKDLLKKSYSNLCVKVEDAIIEKSRWVANEEQVDVVVDRRRAVLSAAAVKVFNEKLSFADIFRNAMAYVARYEAFLLSLTTRTLRLPTLVQAYVEEQLEDQVEVSTIDFGFSPVIHLLDSRMEATGLQGLGGRSGTLSLVRFSGLKALGGNNIASAAFAEIVTGGVHGQVDVAVLPVSLWCTALSGNDQLRLLRAVVKRELKKEVVAGKRETAKRKANALVTVAPGAPGGRKCWGCNQTGHVKANCPKKKKPDGGAGAASGDD